MKNESTALIYIVDDDPEFRDLMAAVFKKRKIEVEGFDSPADFLKRLKERRPTLCLVDLHFGGVSSGFQLVQAVRKVLGPSLPLIVTSSSSDMHSVSHAMEIGASDYVIKPVDLDILFTKLEYYSRALKQDSSFNFFPVPEARAAGKMNLELHIREIDEVGIVIRTPHLFVKGTYLKVHGPLAEEILGAGESFPITITDSQVEDGFYIAKGEIDPTNEKVLQLNRLWLGKQKGPLAE
jgi:DNA-binding response OmpR family regulator